MLRGLFAGHFVRESTGTAKTHGRSPVGVDPRSVILQRLCRICSGMLCRWHLFVSHFVRESTGTAKAHRRSPVWVVPFQQFYKDFVKYVTEDSVEGVFLPDSSSENQRALPKPMAEVLFEWSPSSKFTKALSNM